MASGALLETVIPLLTVLTPLVGIPLTIITFYLRSLREQQITTHVELIRRLDALESSAGELRRAVREFERNYTTKEEWLRECMQARQTLSQLTEATVRLEALGAAGCRPSTATLEAHGDSSEDRN